MTHTPTPMEKWGKDHWSTYWTYPACAAAEQRKALDQISLAIHVDGELLGIDTSPAPHKFSPATKPPEPWCRVCWLGSREDCHDEERIKGASEWKQ